MRISQVVLIIVALVPSLVHSQQNKTLISCEFGKVVFGSVIPLTTPIYRIPKIWSLSEPSASSNDYDGHFMPDDHAETGIQFYRNYGTDDLVNSSFATSRVHQMLDEYGKKWRYFNLKLDRLTGEASVEVRAVETPNDESRRMTDKYPVVDRFNGICKKVEKKL